MSLPHLRLCDIFSALLQDTCIFQWPDEYIYILFIFVDGLLKKISISFSNILPLMDFKRLISQHFFLHTFGKYNTMLYKVQYNVVFKKKKKNRQSLICAYLRLLLVLCFTVHIKTLHVENKKSTKTQNKKNWIKTLHGVLL